jgi:hypothetical protein
MKEATVAAADERQRRWQTGGDDDGGGRQEAFATTEGARRTRGNPLKRASISKRRVIIGNLLDAAEQRGSYFLCRNW